MHTSRNRRIAAAVSLALAAAAPAQYLGWIDQFGTSEWDSCYAVAADGAGGAFAAGSTSGNLGAPLEGPQDAFVSRYSSGGGLKWLRQFGPDFGYLARALQTDGEGGVIVAGEVWGSYADVFLARLDASGDTVWHKQYGTDTPDTPNGIAPDGAGGVFVCGDTGMAGVDFNAFVARFDGDGNQIWWQTFGTDSTDFANGLAPDGAGGAFVAGLTDGELGGPSAGGSDAFLARYDASGQRLWVIQFGSDKSDQARGVAVDGLGGVFVGGYTRGDLGGPNAGSEDVFVARYDSAGSPKWITQFGSSGLDEPQALAPDANAGVLVWGHTQGKLGDSQFGSNDPFLARFDEGGHKSWVTQIGTKADDRARGMAPDGAGGVFAGGQTLGAFEGENQGDWDGFVTHLSTALCYPDCDASKSLDLFDFLCFVNQFNARDLTADCDGDGALDLFDFLCFTNAFNAGC